VLPIETGIPIPDLNARKRVYPFPGMKVDDSFIVVVPAEPAETFLARRKKKQAFIADRARRYGDGTGHRFTTRQVENGVRVWRIR